MWKGDQISGCQGRGMAGGGCQGVTMEGGTESFVVGGSCVFLLCSGCMNLHTWQQDPGAHRTLLPSVSALVSGLHCVRCHQEGKLGEGSLGPSLYCLCNLLLFHLESRRGSLGSPITLSACDDSLYSGGSQQLVACSPDEQRSISNATASQGKSPVPP